MNLPPGLMISGLNDLVEGGGSMSMMSMGPMGPMGTLGIGQLGFKGHNIDYSEAYQNDYTSPILAAAWATTAPTATENASSPSALSASPSYQSAAHFDPSAFEAYTAASQGQHQYQQPNLQHQIQSSPLSHVPIKDSDSSSPIRSTQISDLVGTFVGWGYLPPTTTNQSSPAATKLPPASSSSEGFTAQLFNPANDDGESLSITLPAMDNSQTFTSSSSFQQPRNAPPPFLSMQHDQNRQHESFTEALLGPLPLSVDFLRNTDPSSRAASSFTNRYVPYAYNSAGDYSHQEPETVEVDLLLESTGTGLTPPEVSE
jgi:hypothetical protein